MNNDEIEVMFDPSNIKSAEITGIWGYYAEVIKLTIF